MRLAAGDRAISRSLATWSRGFRHSVLAALLTVPPRLATSRTVSPGGLAPSRRTVSAPGITAAPSHRAVSQCLDAVARDLALQSREVSLGRSRALSPRGLGHLAAPSRRATSRRLAIPTTHHTASAPNVAVSRAVSRRLGAVSRAYLAASHVSSSQIAASRGGVSRPLEVIPRPGAQRARACGPALGPRSWHADSPRAVPPAGPCIVLMRNHPAGRYVPRSVEDGA
jgi:hypothetical protein